MTTTFAALGVPDEIVRALDRRGITAPFPIQAATIPDALAGRDLCGKAPTGSGKTIAFGVPMVARVKRAAPKRPKGLVLAPTRELALQVADELRAMSGDLRVLPVYGGAGLGPQIKELRNGVDIVVACPGRLLDLIERKTCDLRDVSFAVVDEADRMADMGFLPDVRRILDMTNEVRQTVLFSATLDGAIDSLVKNYQHDPVVHEMPDEQAGDIAHHFWVTERHDRLPLLASIIDRTGPSIVFCRTKHGSDRVARQLANAGVKSAAIHGNRSQAQRERALTAFHRGDVAALVATDVAARGIHVEGVACVVHFDLPPDPKDYIHRSGRTGRAGADGLVVSLFDKVQRKDAVKLKKAVGEGDIEITEADVASLREGPQQAFRTESRRPRPPRIERPTTDDRPVRDERSSRNERPVRDDRPKHRARPVHDEQSARTARPAPTRLRTTTGADPARTDDRSSVPQRGEVVADRSRRDRPRPDRRERIARADDGGRSTQSESRRGPSRSDHEPPSGQNRAERRQAQFTAYERAARAEVNERAERDQGESRRHRLPADTPGGDKVRPSGASRRKAKRENLRASGEDVPRAKKRRSGKPRPPASSR